MSQPPSPSILDTPAGGIRSAAPIILGYLPIGFAAGILGVQAGLSPIEVLLLSLLVYAGSAQFIFASLLGVAPQTLIITIFLINFRHFLYATALSQRLKKLPLPTRIAIGAQLTDESFSLASVLSRPTMLHGGGLIALNLTSQTAWLIGNGAGALTGQTVPLSDGIGFLLIPMFSALLMLNLNATKKKTGHWLAALTAATLMLALETLHPHPLNLLIAAIIAAAVAAIAFPHPQHDPTP